MTLERHGVGRQGIRPDNSATVGQQLAVGFPRDGILIAVAAVENTHHPKHECSKNLKAMSGNKPGKQRNDLPHHTGGPIMILGDHQYARCSRASRL